jgi:hypothetical protein
MSKFSKIGVLIFFSLWPSEPWDRVISGKCSFGAVLVVDKTMCMLLRKIDNKEQKQTCGHF